MVVSDRFLLTFIFNEKEKDAVLIPVFLSLQEEQSSSILWIFIQNLAHQRTDTKPNDAIMEVTPWNG